MQQLPATLALMETLWCNGDWVEEPFLRVPAGDRGLTLGLGVFETILALQGKPRLAERHLERLKWACSRLGWKDPQSAFPGLAETMIELLERRGLGSHRARLRLAVSAGSGPIRDLQAGPDRLVWLRADRCEDPPAEICVMISPWLKNERSPLAGLKCASYAENLLALDHAQRHGFSETLFFNHAGSLCEAAMANIFVVIDGVLTTPPLSSGCLPGITRQMVVESAGAVEAEIRLADLDRASEVFLTSATRGPVRVAKIGDRSLTGGDFVARAILGWNARSCAASRA